MNSRMQSFAGMIMVLALISVGILVGPRLLVEHSTAQNPTQKFNKPLETPCQGQLVSRHAYSECGPDGFWHVVEDDYYSCHDGTTKAFRVSDTPTTQPCQQTTKTTIAGNALGYHVGTNNANGLVVTTFDTPQGKIKVNLTDDVAAGDTISGTVETEPAGKNDSERAQNQSELNGEVIELEGQKTKVGDKKISCTIPKDLTPDANTIVLDYHGQKVAIGRIPILIVPPATPQFILPTGGQQGRPIEIKGNCNGIFAPQDYVKIGGTVLPPLAESPRKIVVQNTSNTVGQMNIECNENGSKMECPWRNLGIKLSAPKLSLLRGETTTLHVTVMGLSGIKDDLPLDLINNSPSVIKMSGGDAQNLMIPHIQVQADGTYSIDRTLTGIMSGGFGITGTVRWPDVCTPAARKAD